MLFLLSEAHAVTSLEQIDRLGEVYGALLDYRPVAIPGPRNAGLIEVAAELDPLPSINNQIGAKAEPVRTPPVIGRVRADWSPLNGVRLGGYLIPPLTVSGSTARVLGMQAEYGWGHEVIRSSMRIFIAQGTVDGIFTDTGAADRFTLSSAGMDLRSGWFAGNWAIYGGLGKGSNRTQFSLGADGAVIDGQHDYIYALAGVGWTQGPWVFVAEQESTFSYLSNLMFTVTYGF